jgi:hypothetical protein
VALRAVLIKNGSDIFFEIDRTGDALFRVCLGFLPGDLSFDAPETAKQNCDPKETESRQGVGVERRENRHGLMVHVVEGAIVLSTIILFSEPKSGVF